MHGLRCIDHQAVLRHTTCSSHENWRLIELTRCYLTLVKDWLVRLFITIQHQLLYFYADTHDILDWKFCVVCQKDTTQGRPHKSFLYNVENFRRMRALPVPVKFGSDIDVASVVKNRAHWHKSCHRKFSTDKLENVASKRKSEDGAGTDESQHPKRQLLDDQNLCIFCHKSNNLVLHEIRTFD